MGGWSSGRWLVVLMTGVMRRLAVDAKSVVSCEVSLCEMVSCRVCSLNGGVSYKACRHETSPCPVVGEIPVCPGCRLKSASGGFGCYFGTTPQFEIPTRPNRNIFRNSQNLFLIA